MKKLFTLCAAAALSMSAFAEKVTDVNFVYGVDMTEWNLYEMGYKPVIKDGVLWSENPISEETGEPGWYQYFMMPAFPASVGKTYEVTFKVKGSTEGTVNVQARWSWSEDAINAEIPVTTSWNEVTVFYPEVNGTNVDLIFQSGGYVGEIEWASILVQHDEKVGKPKVWEERLVNGDASMEWSEVVETGANTAFDDQDNNFKICAWSKWSQQNPVPAPIEVVDGNRVFVVHATDCPTPEEDASAWDNQFWIQSPKSWPQGEQIKVHFRYKASQAAKTNTQIHKQNPSDYLHWQAVGDVNFTTEWQEFDKEFSFDGSMASGWSIAFNLNPDVKTATDFYFDDLSWMTLKLDEGYFIAGDFNDWNLDEAIEMVADEEGIYVAEVGSESCGASVIKISTKRGNDTAFDANLLKVEGEVVDDPDEWLNYSMSFQKIKLPKAGIWRVMVDEEYQMVAFECLLETEGPKQEVDNSLRLVVPAGEKQAEAWDNQFWIVSNRVLASGEVTHLKFEYKADDPAKSSTQCHAAPGAYIHWGAIGDINFTEDWQTYEADFTIPAQCDAPEDSTDPAPGTPRMQSIAFNLSEYAAANNYQFRNFVWTCGGESLINNGDLTGDDFSSFIMKVNQGETAGQLVPATGLEQINAEVEAPAIMFNLNGQRVNKANGLVIKNGKIMFVK